MLGGTSNEINLSPHFFELSGGQWPRRNIHSFTTTTTTRIRLKRGREGEGKVVKRGIVSPRRQPRREIDINKGETLEV